MSRVTGPSSDDSTFAPALARPTSTARRLRGDLERLRLTWRRVVSAGGAGLLAAVATVTWLPALRSGSPTADRPATTARQQDSDASAFIAGEPTPRQLETEQATLADDQRILALDRSAIALPVSVGSLVEVVGLRPTLDDVRAEVIVGRARVVGVTEEAILVAVDADAAHTAVEVAAVGRVTILGRDGPPSG